MPPSIQAEPGSLPSDAAASQPGASTEPRTTASLVETAKKHLLANYRPAPVVFVRGQGSTLFDKEGASYLDFAAGVAVTALGHAHPKLVATIAEQAAKVMHVSNYFYNEENILLAEELCQKTGFDRAFFCNSGAEANEALLKLCRRHYSAKGDKGRYRIIAFESSFHGRTIATVNLTGNASYSEGFGPKLEGVTHVPYGDLEAVRKVMGPDVAGILVEAVQGEGGVVPAPAGYLAGLRALADEHGAMLLLDEVQTGIGRTGTLLGCEQDGVKADVVSLAKGLGGGFPIGAMLVPEKYASALPPGTHGSTFGGNPLACAASRVVLRALSDDGVLENVNQMGELLRKGLEALAAKHPDLCEGERGRGLLRGLILKKGLDGREALEKMRAEGVLLTVAGGRVLRFTPPLVVTAAEIEDALARVDRALLHMRIESKAAG